MVRLPPTRSTAVVLLVPAMVVAAILIAVSAPAKPVASVPSAGASLATSTIRPVSISTTPTDWPYPPLPTPTQRPCTLLGLLPAQPPPVATPAVAIRRASVLFASPLYERSSDGALTALGDPEGDWEMGLWFAAPGGAPPRLLSASAHGMVLPLALSPSGAKAAVWWLPDWRAQGDPACQGGIYLLSTATGVSHLVVAGDWTDTSDPAAAPSVVPAIEWTDPRGGDHAARPYRLPEAAFSSDDRYLALIDGPKVSIYADDETNPRWSHQGECTGWAWSPVGATFVAGCEGMTSASIVNAVDGSSATSLALPWLGAEARATGWGRTEGSAIGWTRDSRIRLAGFYGFPIGCEGGAQCHISKPTYAIVTVDPFTGVGVVRSAAIDFMIEPTAGVSPQFSADASWVYVEGQTADGSLGAKTLRATGGGLASAVPPEAFVGAARDGSSLFGSSNAEAGNVDVIALDAAGRTSTLGTIGWPLGAAPTISVVGLRAAATPA